MKALFISMHFVFTVSTGATITTLYGSDMRVRNMRHHSWPNRELLRHIKVTYASATPAPSPATKFLAGVKLPFVSRSDSLITLFNPKRMPALGILPIKVGASPRYNDINPVVRTV
jgi:hypothetical protein